MNTMKIYNTYREAKANAVTFRKNGKTYVQYPPYHDFIEGKDYGDLSPKPDLVPAMLAR